ncbi:DEAD/DEAH box helicase family protein [Lysinibacillus halotolerans]|uniref:DEAD/DEAH box helicase n=1 Tax=Lysinibacillus halotolerans TaxID=1368476 RepID=A0A3M8HBV1_9BACI|nr:DEAD/DEAH box helicase family protein [Lysinibacillus halotolerans]RNC99550.1 DEAD/DEAH box helicase [Lysinibacillus halotolerans]
MGLNDLNLQFTYRSDNDKMHRDFYEPCLKQSIKYDRAAGYFSSSILKELARGFEHFLFFGGKIRIVSNVHLSEEDIEAIDKGYKLKSSVIEENLLREIYISKEALEDDTLNVLAWLIAEGQLEIKIAHPNNNSLYHEKFGIFTDKNEISVAFIGSANETLGGVVSNFEKIDVYYGEYDIHRIKRMKEDFENLWANETNGLTVIPFPESVRREILKCKKRRPEPEDEEIIIEPRQYQIDAINALESNNWQGILEMATGTGKTITSLLAAMKYYSKGKRIFLVIFAPFAHLVDQWKTECEQLGFKKITLCYQSQHKWREELESTIQDYNIGLIDQHVVITTYKTATLSPFKDIIVKIGDSGFLIADECHYIGSRSFYNMFFNQFSARIGLSATPNRWWDEQGTAFMKSIFGEVVFEYTLEQAIDDGKLTQYEYNPHIVSLTESELERYKKLTFRIITLFNTPDVEEEKIQKLNRERALILAKAYNKIPHLIGLLEKKGIKNISHTLVYVAQGQVDSMTSLLYELGLRVHRFDSHVPNAKRKQILEAFDRGEIQVLVAIKCLDEGVDVPSTKVAYFLASTSNPREFVQRRGRILRTYNGKILSEIHDFIVLPDGVDDETFSMIAKKELPRFAEFSSSAINGAQSKRIINEVLDYYNLSYLMDKKPWEVYEELKEEYDKDGGIE